jgi:hypothetical protein
MKIPKDTTNDALREAHGAADTLASEQRGSR